MTSSQSTISITSIGTRREPWRRRGFQPNATVQAPQEFGPAFLPHIAPYPNGQGDVDGQSHDINDCNKGCIDGNPG